MFKTARKYLSSRKTPVGFTLVELLVVIAIIGILAIIAFLVIDPIELNRKSRDTVRLSDLGTLNGVITVAVQGATQSGALILCANGIPTPCNGNSNPGTPANRAIDGTGWVKVNLTGQAATLPVLPIDPVNTGNTVYVYATNATADAWEIDAVLESKAFKGKMATDGGNNDNLYEIGSNLNILP